MEVTSLNTCPSRPLTEYGSTDAVVAFIAGDDDASIVRITLAAGGRIGRHAGRGSQLFIIVEGSGRVRAGGGEPIEVNAGDAIRWEAAEEHETTTDEGLVALVIQAARLPLTREVP
jgi:quercetin dioxygenase-like cupin family protein